MRSGKVIDGYKREIEARETEADSRSGPDCSLLKDSDAATVDMKRLHMQTAKKSKRPCSAPVGITQNRHSTLCCEPVITV